LKGFVAIVVFLAMATLAEYLVVLYAMSLGVKDTGALEIAWPLTITISPLFHLIPTAVIITLLFTWVYLTKKLSTRPSPTTEKSVASGVRRTEMKRSKSRTSQTARTQAKELKATLSARARANIKGFSYLWKRVRFARITIKSALAVFVVFLILVLMLSLLAYPSLIYQIVSIAYQDKSPLYYFVVAVANSLRGFSEVVSPIGWIATAVNNGLLALAPSVGTIGLALGSLIAPFANLDPPGKYLLFQNTAMWISVLSVLFYGHYTRGSYRYKKK
jgi:hypothetical protein